MDKPDFLHKLKGLRAFRCAGQALYPVCTEGVQISGHDEFSGFCTFAPVDMHGFVHTLFASWLACFRREPGWRAKKTPVSLSVAGSEACHPQTRPGRKKIFLQPAAFLLQVYNQDRYTRIVVVLTTALFCG